MLIHYIGDIHQPLHASSRYTKEFPKGDEGGNGFKLSVNGFEDITNLHALWDSVAASEATDIKLPLSDNNWEKLGDISTRLRTEYPIEKVLTNRIPSEPSISAEWAEESYKIVRDEVYAGLNSDSDYEFQPSKEYMDKSRIIAERQIARAGYRLAQVLDNIWASH